MQRFRGPLPVLLSRLGAVALIYSLLRITFVLLNKESFPNVPFAAYWGGVRFDLSAIAWLNMPWVLLCIASSTESGWFARSKKGLFHLANAIGFFFACADLEYYKFTLKRSTADIFGIMAGGGDTGSLATVFAEDYWYIVLIFIACVLLAEMAYRSALRLASDERLSTARNLIWRGGAVAIVVIASRGGLQLMPIGVMNAADHVTPAYFPVVLNTPFTIMTSLGKPVVEVKDYLPSEEAEALWPVTHQYGDTTVLDGNPNIVVIILESFSAAYSAKLSGGEGYMPFLDSLMDRSLNFTRAYANGRRSIDGIPAITASIPELMDEAFITSIYSQSRFTSLASLLAAEGYRTSFYHGGRNGTMGFDGFALSAGFQRYMGLNEYGNEKDYDGSWGIWDRPYLQYFVRELDKEQAPFFSTVFTLSSHHPYRLPPGDEQRFRGGDQKIHASLRYADDALRQFFGTARQSTWFDNTLFVITADHTADIDRNGQNYSEAVDYHVPLLLYMPDRIAPATTDRTMQHIDIAPTVLDLLGYHEAFFCFGSSAFRHERMPMAVTHTTGSYLAIDSSGVLRYDGSTTPSKNEKLRVLQAAIQQFNNRMVQNQLAAP